MKILLAIIFNIFNIIWMIAYYSDFKDDWSSVTHTKPEFAIVPYIILIIFAVIVSTIIILRWGKDPNQPILPFWSALSSKDPEEMERTMEAILKENKERSSNEKDSITTRK